jgi:hypothetical protein
LQHGGRRPGAGRKKGSTPQKTKELADRLTANGPTPLEVMLTAMKAALKKDDLSAAHAFAKDAAPYIHPRLAAVAHSGTLNIAPAEVDDAKLYDIAFGSGARIASPQSDTKVTH